MIQKKIFKITGMHCASCALVIEDVLKKIPGINSASVNFATENLYVEFDRNDLDSERIIDSIKKVGYELYEVNGKFDLPGGEVLRFRKERKKLVISFIFSAPVIVLSVFNLFDIFLPKNVEALTVFIQVICSTIVIGLSLNIWRSGLRAMLRFSPNMDSLIFIGTATAYFYSILLVLFNFLNNYPNNIEKLYFESAVFILIFILFGKYLENITKAKTNQAIKKLIELQPKEATVMRGKKEIKIPIFDLKTGDLVLVKPGERVPADGVVVDGYSGVDEKMITGESIPIEKKIGDKIIGATINKTGILLIKIEKTGKNTFLSQIIKITSEALGSKPPIQLLADKISLYFVPLVIIIAVFSFLAWIAIGESFYFATNIFVSVLVIACPCALGLATPTAIIVGSGIAAQNGILIKNSDALEATKHVNLIAFDKTGTLTKGEAIVTDVLIFNDITQTEALSIAGSLEKNSEHPLASAIMNYVKEKKYFL